MCYCYKNFASELPGVYGYEKSNLEINYLASQIPARAASNPKLIERSM